MASPEAGIAGGNHTADAAEAVGGPPLAIKNVHAKTQAHNVPTHPRRAGQVDGRSRSCVFDDIGGRFQVGVFDAKVASKPTAFLQPIAVECAHAAGRSRPGISNFGAASRLVDFRLRRATVDDGYEPGAGSVDT